MDIKAMGKINFSNIKSYKNVQGSKINEKPFTSDYQEIDYDTYDAATTNINLDSSQTKIDDKAWYEVALATGAVGTTSIASGVFKIGEYALDGLTWANGMIRSGFYRLFGDKITAEKIETETQDIIATDMVGEMNKLFYENTRLGQIINDTSALKYDSKVANTIQNVTTEATIAIGATAATVATGGAAAPVFAGIFATGFTIGAGQSAEKRFQDTENRNFWKDSIQIGLDGGIKGVSTVATGRAGATAFQGIKTLGSLGWQGIKGAAPGIAAQLSKEAIKSTIKTEGLNIAKGAAINTFKDTDFYTETGSVILSNVKNCIETGKVTKEEIKEILLKTCGIYVENYIGNLAGGLLASVIDKNQFVSSATDTYHPNELLKPDFDLSAEGQDLAQIKSYSADVEQIKSIFCETYGLDYISDASARKIVNSLMQILEDDNFSNEDVRYIFRNIDKLKKMDPNFALGSWDKVSQYVFSSGIMMDIDDLDISKSIFPHELGHASYHILLGDGSNKIALTGNNIRALSIARENLFKNSEDTRKLLNECFEMAEKADVEATSWWQTVKASEHDRISKMVDALYDEDNYADLTSIAIKGRKVAKIEDYLKNAGLEKGTILEYLDDKESMNSIAKIHNALANVNSHREILIRDYTHYGDYGTSSGILDSILESDSTFKYTHGHSKDYWKSNPTNSYDETLAEYISLSANGRTSAIDRLRSLCGNEIFDDLDKTIKNIADTLRLG